MKFLSYRGNFTHIVQFKLINQEIVVFDVDNTILNGQSQKLFLSYLRSNKILGWYPYFKITYWFFLYKLRIVNNPDKIMNYGISFSIGKTIEEIDKIVDDFFEKELKKNFYEDAIKLVQKHLDNGRVVILVSSSINFLIKKIAKFLKVQHYLCTKAEIFNGKYTGKLEGGLVYGKKKAELVEDFAKNNKLSLNNSWSYGDHISDKYVLEIADHPFIVNPNKEVLVEAINNGWVPVYFNK